MPMNKSGQSTLSLKEGRFERLSAVEWWEQDKLAETRVIVVGAGALGNEVIKNLVLLGIGHMVIVDMDRIETSNLNRSVLFREADRNRFKAECAARTAKELYPDLDVLPITGNVLSDVGLGYFRWADVVVGALDNREARVFVNKVCAQVNRPWIDGGIEVLNGIVRGFAPPATACYECTMNKTDWEILDKRRSCSLLAQRAELGGHVPTTVTTASVIGAIQAQEVIKRVHNMDVLLGRGFIFEGETHNSYTVNYPIKPGCPWHEAPVPIKTKTGFHSDTPLQEIHDFGGECLGGVDAVELGREIVHQLTCPDCGKVLRVFRPVERLTGDQTLCERCGTGLIPSYFHGITTGDPLLTKTAGQIGCPKWDILWVRRGENYVGIELSGDAPFPLKDNSKSPGKKD